MTTLAHFSDPHLPLPPVGGPGPLLGKRLTGWLSWRRRRRFLHEPRVLAALVADIRRRRPDHIAITGDLVNISLPEEFRRAADWLASLGDAAAVTVIPGNHDAYVPMPWAESAGLWAGCMAGERAGRDGPPRGPEDFPFVRRIGEIALVGLNSACPTPPFCATGRLGARQLRETREVLERLGREGLCRVVLLHHPPLEGEAGRRKRLVDAAAFRAAIAGGGAELVLHGHTHRHASGVIDGPRPTPVSGVPSASANGRHKGAAAWHLYRPYRDGPAWRIEVTVRQWDPASGIFATVAGGEVPEALPDPWYQKVRPM